MTDATPGATAAPPKKRSFFKKAAWQTQVKPEGEKEQDIFSHSNEFKDIVAEQAKRKQQEKKVKEEEKKRKHEEDRERKRRRISDEVVEDSKPLRSGPRTSPRTKRKESKGCVLLSVHESLMVLKHIADSRADAIGRRFRLYPRNSVQTHSARAMILLRSHPVRRGQYLRMYPT